jgi:hypothetical protein
VGNKNPGVINSGGCVLYIITLCGRDSDSLNDRDIVNGSGFEPVLFRRFTDRKTSFPIEKSRVTNEKRLYLKS